MTRVAAWLLTCVLAGVPLAAGAQTIPLEWDKDDVAGQLMDVLPPRRAGQWEIGVWHITGDRVRLRMDHPPIHLCIDAATDRNTMRLALIPVPSCRGKGDVKRVGDAWVLDETCMNGAVERKTTISGDSQSIMLRVEEKGRRGNIVPVPLKTHTARWVSPACAPGFEPGLFMPGEGITQVKELPPDSK